MSSHHVFHWHITTYMHIYIHIYKHMYIQVYTHVRIGVIIYYCNSIFSHPCFICDLSKIALSPELIYYIRTTCCNKRNKSVGFLLLSCLLREGFDKLINFSLFCLPTGFCRAAHPQVHCPSLAAAPSTHMPGITTQLPLVCRTQEERQGQELPGT